MAVAALLCASLVLDASPGISTRAEAQEALYTCQGAQLPVALAPGEPLAYHVVGQLCSGPNSRNTVHVLISGATYGHLYWDFPLQPQRYSYVRALTISQFATFNFDRIGIGESDRPPADLVTMDSGAFVVHQIVQALRDGRLGTFATVILVGHSLGSGIASVEASRFNDADGVILSGFLHAVGPGFAQVPLTLYPAQSDPRFAGQNLPEGYFTTLPGTRTGFYLESKADPAVIAMDDLTKETITIGEINTFPPLVLSPSNPQGIHVPVLVVIGESDNIFCTPPLCPEAQLEPGYYDPDARVEVRVLANAGHDLNLHWDAQAFFAITREWTERHFGK